MNLKAKGLRHMGKLIRIGADMAMMMWLLPYVMTMMAKDWRRLLI